MAAEVLDRPAARTVLEPASELPTSVSDGEPMIGVVGHVINAVPMIQLPAIDLQADLKREDDLGRNFAIVRDGAVPPVGGVVTTPPPGVHHDVPAVAVDASMPVGGPRICHAPIHSAVEPD